VKEGRGAGARGEVKERGCSEGEQRKGVGKVTDERGRGLGNKEHPTHCSSKKRAIAPPCRRDAADDEDAGGGEADDARGFSCWARMGRKKTCGVFVNHNPEREKNAGKNT
jgi:hypothetical protein